MQPVAANSASSCSHSVVLPQPCTGQDSRQQAHPCADRMTGAWHECARRAGLHPVGCLGMQQAGQGKGASVLLSSAAHMATRARAAGACGKARCSQQRSWRPCLWRTDAQHQRGAAAVAAAGAVLSQLAAAPEEDGQVILEDALPAVATAAADGRVFLNTSDTGEFLEVRWCQQRQYCCSAHNARQW